MRIYWVKTLGLALAATITLVGGAAAEAHKGVGEGPPDAATWVRQALAFLDLKPPNVGEAVERLEGALKAKDPAGVDPAAVREAMDALKAKEVGAAHAALTRALLPPPPPSAEPERAARPPVTPPEVDEETAAHHLPGASLKALEPRFAGSPGELVVLALGTVLIAAGLVAARVTGHRRRGEAR